MMHFSNLKTKFDVLCGMANFHLENNCDGRTNYWDIVDCQFCLSKRKEWEENNRQGKL